MKTRTQKPETRNGGVLPAIGRRGFVSSFCFLASGFSCWLLVSGFSSASACSVPVFRYALERWQAAPYQVLVFHRGPLTDEDRSLVGNLNKLGTDGDQQLNLALQDVDLAVDQAKIKPEVQAVFDQQNKPRLPWVVVRFPPSVEEPADVWAGPLDAATKAMTESPARKEIVSRLAHGQSAVWLLLESGDKATDDAAAAKLAADLPALQKAMHLPEQDPNDPDILLNLPLQIEFSVLRLSRDVSRSGVPGPNEKLLVSSLLHSESDLAGLAGPMVFPIFGRGRALPALVGKGINSDNLEHCALFITGACACEIKDATPGFDLLLPAEWNSLLVQHLVRERRPELSGLAGFLPPKDKQDERLSPTLPASQVNTSDNNARTSTTNSGSDAPSAPRAGPTDSPTKTSKQVTEVHYRPPHDAEVSPASAPPADAPETNSILLRNVLVVVIGGLVLVTALTVIFLRR